MYAQALSLYKAWCWELKVQDEPAGVLAYTQLSHRKKQTPQTQGKTGTRTPEDFPPG